MRSMYLLLIASVLASGCASHTGVVPSGQGTYMIAKQQPTGFSGLGNMKAEIIAEGQLFCADQGREFVLLAAKETQPPYIFGNYPRSEIVFTCKSNTPALSATSL